MRGSVGSAIARSSQRHEKYNTHKTCNNNNNNSSEEVLFLIEDKFKGRSNQYA